MRKNEFSGYFFLHLVMILFMTMVISSAAAAFRYLSEGMEVPMMTLKDLDNRDLSLDILKKKKAGIVVFFATWSERSLKQLSDLEEMKRALDDSDFEIVAINVDHEQMSEEEIDIVRKKAEELGITFPILLDSGFVAFEEFGVVAVPSTGVVKSGGVLYATLSGYPTFARKELRDRVEVLLGKRKEEVIVAEEVTGYTPARASLLNYNLGKRLYRSGMVSKAEKKLKLAVKSDEKFVKPRVLLGDIYLVKSVKRKEYLSKAKDMYAGALETSPGDEAASTGFARVLIKEGNIDEAEKQVDSVLEKNPAFTSALIVKAMVLAEKGKGNEYEKYVEEAVQLAPMDPEILALAGVVYEGKGNLIEAARYYREAGRKLGYE